MALNFDQILAAMEADVVGDPDGTDDVSRDVANLGRPADAHDIISSAP